MESSTVLAFRIFVMLSCLIIVPMAAIFGSAFPEVVKTVLVDRIVAWSTGKPLDSDKSAAEMGEPADLHGVNAAQSVQNGNNWEAPRWGAAEAAPSPNSDWQPVPLPAPNRVVPAGAQTIGHPPGAPQASLAVAADPSHSPANSYPLEPAGGELPYRSVPVEGAAPSRQQFSYPANPAGSAAIGGGPEPQAGSEGFTAMERKLREYGASYYLLETSGNEGELYRFHCRMAISSNPNYTRHFEATDRDALKAMAQVLQKIEAWRAGRPQ